MGLPTMAPDRRAVLATAAGILLGATGIAQRSASGQVALRQAVRDAANDRVVAIVATHPDDQWMLPAAYLRFRLGFRVAAILFTRGEGGQNITGPEVGDALGRIRTFETEASGEALDCDIWYLNRTDGGYCRTGQEALELWGRRSTTEDLARILRRIRPDIVLTTHNPTETHGHDQGLLEVLSAAVDLACSTEFSVDGLPPADIRRLFRGAGDDDHDLSLPADTVDVDRGRTYRQIAYEAFRLHASQAPFRTIDSLFQPDLELVSLPIAGRPLARNFTEGLSSLFEELREALPNRTITSLRDDFERQLSFLLDDRRQLLNLALDLIGRLERIDTSSDGDLAVRIARRAEALERVVRHACALRASVEFETDAVAVPGEPLPLTVHAHFANQRVEILGIQNLGPGELRVDDAQHDVHKARLEASLEVPRGLVEDVDAKFRADRFEDPLRIAVRYAVHREDGSSRELQIPLPLDVRVRPSVELEAIPPALLISDDIGSVAFAVRVRRNTVQPVEDTLTVRTNLGVTVSPVSQPVSMAGENLEEYYFRLGLPANAATMKARVRLGDQSIDVPLHRVDVRIDRSLRVGLVRGVDDTSRSMLRVLGVQLVELTDTVLPTRDLSDLDTIVIDIRALRSHTAARAGFNRLIDFVRDGGRLVVFYHKDQEFNLESSGFRGFPPSLPLHIGKGRVTREDQPVKVLIEDHILLNYPNRVQASDWDGWVQERGLYFADDYSDRYDELLSMADPGQPEERGSLLYGRVGDGEFVFCALALYRQLKLLHPGACRLFANLVSRAAD
ncbi:MAG: PIG-L family deacetylase [Planctomycetes bacterium]|nr:PIG-L family deacetylase [Planctomycetota bacterium]